MSLTPGHLKDLVWSFTAHFSRSQEEDPAPSLAATSVPASALGWGGMGSSSPFLSSTWSHSRHQVEMVDKKTRLWGWKTTAPGAWGRADNEVPTECVSVCPRPPRRREVGGRGCLIPRVPAALPPDPWHVQDASLQTSCTLRAPGPDSAAPRHRVGAPPLPGQLFSSL